MRIDRNYYMPSETQRAEIKACAQLIKQRLAERRRARERERLQIEAAREAALYAAWEAFLDDVPMTWIRT